jgi:GT2 family glycosyltransferase
VIGGFAHSRYGPSAYERVASDESKAVNLCVVQPVLSIIIVAYKSFEEIGPCLASIPQRLGLDSAVAAESTRLRSRPRGAGAVTAESRLDGEGAAGDVEVIVVDNSPGDGTGEVVQRDFPWVRYIAAPENLGFGRANNRGFRESSGEFVLFLNPDTVNNAAALEHCVRRLRTELDIGLISPKLVLADGSMDPACRRSIPTLWDGFCRAIGLAAAFPGAKFFAGYNLTHLPVDGTYDVGAVNGAFIMARREVLEGVAEASLACEKPVAGVGDPGPASARPATTENREERIVEGPLARSTSSGPRASRGAGARGHGEGSEPLAGARGHELAVFDEAFFMYGDDLDLCIRVARAGHRIVYDGRVEITHLKGVSVAKDYDRMACAIFDANRDVYLKHFNPRGRRIGRWKYQIAFGAWKRLARLRARLRGYRRVKPL